MLTAEIKDVKGVRVLALELPISNPTPSSTGKMMLVASTGGFQATTVIIDEKPVKVSVMAGFNAK